MRKLLRLLLPLFIIGCTGQGLVEIGANDGVLFDGTLGDMTMTITKIELTGDGAYTTIWEGMKDISVAIQVSDFVSITDGYVEISPGAYQTIRVSGEALRYIQDSTSIPLVTTSFQFTASSFSEIVIEENDELQLVVGIMSQTWFDLDSLKIKDGYEPFQGAFLRIYY
jgi:hypothetical protein